MKAFLLFLLISPLYLSAQTYINPAGKYKLLAETEKVGDDIYGRQATMLVKLVKNGKVFISIEGCRGAPSYNIGTLKDTVPYKDNSAVCTSPADSSCRIVIHFSAKGATVAQYAEDINSSCGFGHAVDVSGEYQKLLPKSE